MHEPLHEENLTPKLRDTIKQCVIMAILSAVWAIAYWVFHSIDQVCPEVTNIYTSTARWVFTGYVAYALINIPILYKILQSVNKDAPRWKILTWQIISTIDFLLGIAYWAFAVAALALKDGCKSNVIIVLWVNVILPPTMLTCLCLGNCVYAIISKTKTKRLQKSTTEDFYKYEDA